MERNRQYGYIDYQNKIFHHRNNNQVNLIKHNKVLRTQDIYNKRFHPILLLFWLFHVNNHLVVLLSATLFQ